MEFRILGPLQVLDGEVEVPLRSPKERELLAVLLLHAGTVVSRERLIDELWGESPPPTAAKALNVHVSQLRKTLARNGHDPVATRPPGYAVAIEPDAVDAVRFERLVAEARAKIAAGELESADGLLREALALWRGPALDGVELQSRARLEVGRLEELRLAAQMERIDCDLALGLHEQVIGELEALVAEHPLRERLRGQLMLALYRSGRQADALRCYRDARETLVGELGIEPSLPLQRLERAILNQDRSLEATAGVMREVALPPPAAAARQIGPAGRRLLLLVLAGVAALGLAAGAVVALIGRGSSGSQRLVRPDAVGEIDPGRNELTAQTAVGSRPSAVLVAAGSLWSVNQGDGTVSRVDRATMRTVETIHVGADPTAIASGAGAVWVVVGAERKLVRINTDTNTSVDEIRVGNGAAAVAYGLGSLWVANGVDGTVLRIDPSSKRRRLIVVGGKPIGIAIAAGSVWVANQETGTIARIDPAINRTVAAIPVGAGAAAVAAAGGGVWVANAVDGTVMEIDPRRNAVVATVEVGRGPAALAATSGAIWVANADGDSIARIDSHARRVVRTLRLGSRPTALTAATGRVWLAAQASLRSHRGGTLTVLAHDGLAELDPVGPGVGATVDFDVSELTRDGLVGLDRRAAVGGQPGIAADLAAALPVPSDDGRTYTFRLRSGIRYSNGEPVRASDVRFAIERVFALGSASAYLQSPFLELGLVGERRCLDRPRDCDLRRAIETDDAARTVSFHLARPDPQFLHKLAFPVFDFVPQSTPPPPARPAALAGTGPYRIAAFQPRRRLVLERNPYFQQWSRAAQPAGFPDRIVFRIGLPLSEELHLVLAGRADVMVDMPETRLAELRIRYTSQVKFNRVAGTYFLFLNTRVPPFNRLNARRALNYAIDRAHVASILRAGSLRADTPTCQALPPNFQAYRPYCPYTLRPSPTGAWTAPDLDTARTLVARSGTRGRRVVVWMQSDVPYGPPLGRYVVRLLRRLGYRAALALRPRDAPPPHDYYSYVSAARNRAQIGWLAWYPDIGTAQDIIEPLFDCRSSIPPDITNDNITGFCDPRAQSLIERARRLDGSDEAAADPLWAAAERRIIDLAPVVPLANPRFGTVVSRRLGNYQYTDRAGGLESQYWVR